MACCRLTSVKRRSEAKVRFVLRRICALTAMVNVDIGKSMDFVIYLDVLRYICSRKQERWISGTYRSLSYASYGSGVPKGELGGFNPPPKFRIFDKVELDCKLSGKRLVFLFQHPN